METAPKPRYPYVLFDLGGTLIYFDGDWTVVTANALRACTSSLLAYGYALDEQVFPLAYYNLTKAYNQRRLDELNEFPVVNVLREALQANGVTDPAPEHVVGALKDMYAVSQAFWHCEDDAHRTLQGLRDAGCRLGILSNASDDADVQVLVDKAGIRSYFDFILTSAVAGTRKPNPRIFQQALAFWPGAQPEQVLMVGDMRSADMAGANRLGMPSAWITRRAGDAGQAPADPNQQPTYTISALDELVSLI